MITTKPDYKSNSVDSYKNASQAFVWTQTSGRPLTMREVLIFYSCLLLFVRWGSAHMRLDVPEPYGKDTLDNSPIDPSGLEFPCKLRAGVYDVKKMNYWTAGQAQTIKFLGSAVHGGGSCQFSITTDDEPTQWSRWKVIHSVVGGCPATADGNLAGDANARVADTFEISLPPQIPDGRYTFAWTWFNRMGRREMYMNCAPISVSGGGRDPAFLDTLPDMFIANLQKAGCDTPENFDFPFPSPGASVTTARNLRMAELNGTACPPMVTGGKDRQSPDLPQPTSKSPTTAMSGVRPQQNEASPHPLGTAALTSVHSAGVSQSLTQQSAIELAASDFNADAMRKTPTDVRPASDIATPTTSSSITCAECSREGSIVCVDEEDFGICDHGCVTRLRLAAGTVCVNGSILRRRAQSFVTSTLLADHQVESYS